MTLEPGEVRAGAPSVAEPLHRGSGPTVLGSQAAAAPPRSPLLSEVVVALAPALDAADHNAEGHALRTAVAGMRLAALLDLGPLASAELFYALLLKDLGAANARAKAFHAFGALAEPAERRLRSADLTSARDSYALLWALLAARAPLARRLRNAYDLLLGSRRRVTSVERARAKVAASVVIEMGFSHGTAHALRSQYERWDGRGRPDGLAGEAIPLSARVLAVAQELARLAEELPPAEVRARLAAEAGARFDPRLVALAERLLAREALLDELASEDLERLVLELEPAERRTVLSAGRADRLLAGLARAIDSKSPWTAQHSERVRGLAVGASLQLEAPWQLGASGRRCLARAALLHDLGKIGAPNGLLDHAGKLTTAQRAVIRAGDALAERVVRRVLALMERALPTDTFSALASPVGHGADTEELAPDERHELVRGLVRLAERFDALIAPRPQRQGVAPAEALARLREEVQDAPPAWRAAQRALERFIASPAAAGLLAPRRFDPTTLVAV